MGTATVPLRTYASDPLGQAVVTLGGTARRGAAVFMGGFAIKPTGTFRGVVVDTLERDELSIPQLGDFVIVDTLGHQQVLQEDGWIDAEDTIALDKPPVISPTKGGFRVELGPRPGEYALRYWDGTEIRFSVDSFGNVEARNLSATDVQLSGTLDVVQAMMDSLVVSVFGDDWPAHGAVYANEDGLFVQDHTGALVASITTDGSITLAGNSLFSGVTIDGATLSGFLHIAGGATMVLETGVNDPESAATASDPYLTQLRRFETSVVHRGASEDNNSLLWHGRPDTQQFGWVNLWQSPYKNGYWASTSPTFENRYPYGAWWDVSTFVYVVSAGGTRGSSGERIYLQRYYGAGPQLAYLESEVRLDTKAGWPTGAIMVHGMGTNGVNSIAVLCSNSAQSTFYVVYIDFSGNYVRHVTLTPPVGYNRGWDVATPSNTTLQVLWGSTANSDRVLTQHNYLTGAVSSTQNTARGATSVIEPRSLIAPYVVVTDSEALGHTDWDFTNPYTYIWYTYADDTHETAYSPAKVVPTPQRANMRVTVPQPPPGATKARLYLASGSSSSASTSGRSLQYESADGVFEMPDPTGPLNGQSKYPLVFPNTDVSTIQSAGTVPTFLDAMGRFGLHPSVQVDTLGSAPQTGELRYISGGGLCIFDGTWWLPVMGRVVAQNVKGSNQNIGNGISTATAVTLPLSGVKYDVGLRNASNVQTKFFINADSVHAPSGYRGWVRLRAHVQWNIPATNCDVRTRIRHGNTTNVLMNVQDRATSTGAIGPTQDVIVDFLVTANATWFDLAVAHNDSGNLSVLGDGSAQTSTWLMMELLGPNAY